ncbi:hypothetical protein A1Q1_04300 [Trichosporon asahii var. asahii CBS 2479]|uniref:Uncharacterized protein n=1 Tax=Trichosporon asahii var. asahii (strain ATCC 90039 / CBS 2479 / JCM 2466 / KCTC 7840 / NBRC 103889/ NCYC 2677 / UAMH 7654) TaxID=1186058 RepID=J6EW82_TRIAS|nr:hypothetical protein A1Q1_04300 [Trichosporon asahii var. asahii CBS 2479]EJT47057.1 hypothetical protein A1Q1_04300 [Trichosporon asahii var. asahii CBS 2479]
MAAAKIGAIQAKLQDESREFQKLEAALGRSAGGERVGPQGVQYIEGGQHDLQARRPGARRAGPDRGQGERGEATGVHQVRNVGCTNNLFIADRYSKRVENQIKEHQEKANKKKDEREFQQLQGPSKAAA